VLVPATAGRVRITGCTAIDLCLVADGSAAAWHDLDRSGSHVHDVAGGLAILLAAGGAALTPDGGPVVLGPDTGSRFRFVAAASDAAGRDLLAAVG
jgi:3'(2'), 5'-bisphosphate nucleotidase